MLNKPLFNERMQSPAQETAPAPATPVAKEPTPTALPAPVPATVRSTSPHAIRCKHCKSTNLEFLPEYHKCIWLRFFRNILVIVLAIFLLPGLAAIFAGLFTGQEFDWQIIIKLATPLLAYIIIAVILSLIIFFKESKTHVQAVCRDCGKIWILK